MITSKKAEGSIGTMILFIAMLIVAAGVGYVLLQTGNILQNKALAVGSQSLNYVTSYVDIITIEEENVSSNAVQIISLKTRIAAGSDGVNLKKSSIQLTLPTTGVDLKYADIPSFDSSQNTDGSKGYWSNSSLETGYFGVEYLIKGKNYVKGYLQRGDVVKFYIQLPGGLTADKVAKIQFVADNGGITSKTYVTSSSITKTRSAYDICTNLEAWWGFDSGVNDTTANAILDYTTNNNNGTLGAGNINDVPKWTSEGYSGGAYIFDGNNDYIEFPYNANLDITSNLTITAWIKTDTKTNAVRSILGKREDSTHVWYAGYSNDERVQYRIGGLSVMLNEVIPNNFADGTWQHYAFVYDKSSLNVYIDGKLVASQSVSGSPYAINSAIWIGATSPGVGNWLGYIDEVKIYSKALTSQEIVNEAAGKFCVL